MLLNSKSIHIFFLTLFYSVASSAQMASMMSGRCAICRSIGSFGMILIGIFMFTVFSGLVALLVFLIKRIKNPPK